jgi:hypothetical protein
MSKGDIMAKKDAEKLEHTIDEPQFTFYLIVINPFDNYQKGQRISEATEIQAVIDNGKTDYCNRIPR